MSAARGFELPTTSMATLSTATAAVSNNLTGNGKGSSNGNSNKTFAPANDTSTTATATATSTATAAAAALLPARRPRHQITRSISEFSPPLKMHRHRHSHHNHPMQHHHRYRKDNRLLSPDERSPGLSVANRNLVLGRSSLDMTSSEFVTPSRSPDSSRRTSALVGPMVVGGEHPLALTPPRRKVGKGYNAAALVEEKGKTASRVTGLKKSLVDVSNFSTSTTRRVDETYYSVLEKKSMLHNTISAIKELAVASRRLTGEFEHGAEDMERDVDGQLATFGRFNEQEQRIEALQGRIEKGRTRIQGLGERVDLVRRRIEGWERADREWQEKTRKRLRIIWIVMSVVFAVLLLLFAGAQYAQQVGGVSLEGAADKGLKMLEGVNRSAGGLEVIGKGKSKEGAALPPLWKDRAQRDEEDRLRVFDEL